MRLSAFVPNASALAEGESMSGNSADSAGRPDAYLDGNVLAGPLSEIFAVDVTAAEGRCGGCGRVGPMATLRVYVHADAAVARCPSCEHVMLRLVRTPDSCWLDLSGAVSVRIPLD